MVERREGKEKEGGMRYFLQTYLWFQSSARDTNRAEDKVDTTTYLKVLVINIDTERAVDEISIQATFS